MKHYLSLISFLLLFCCSTCSSQVVSDGELSSTDSIIVKEYSLAANIRGHEMTGICIINISADSSIVGTIVNEFGIKAFDCSYSVGRAKLFNVMSLLDKWYIRKVLRNDFRFILANMFFNNSEISEKKRTMKKMADGRITVVNNRHKISYSFLPLTKKE